MKSISYEKPAEVSAEFDLKFNEDNQITQIRSPRDACQMNWTRGTKLWGTVVCEYGLKVTVSRHFTDQNSLAETYLFQNETDFDIYTTETGIGIYAPFPDYYTDASVCMKECCNTHIWCGGSSSYIMALRMGGEAPHLGLILKRGSLYGYSVERMAYTDGREEELSNHRGDFILHPDGFHLIPGESCELTWELFWFNSKKDFLEKLLRTPEFVTVTAESFLLTGKKRPEFTVHICTADNKERPVILRDGQEVPCLWEYGTASVKETAAHTGGYHYEIIWKGQKTRTSFLCLPDIWDIAQKRCGFIAVHQQCFDKESCLYGAYLIYDNETHRQYYSHRNDHNGGRERVGMGVLMAFYLQKHPDEKLQKSLSLYLNYVLRELFDEQTGEVFNDAPGCRDYIRLYNYPWMSRFFLEMYHLTLDEIFLDRFFKSTGFFYQEGGAHFYAIGMPMQESVETFRKAGRTEQAEILLKYYREHGEFILSCGKNYPPHEVDYEQSIVAPAAIYMCELYLLTREAGYAAAALEQLKILDLFQGFQPDYHLNEVAVRHWDGYWFGKRRCLGDTFPHYWSALSGYAYAVSKSCCSTDYFSKKADNTLRGVLSLFKEDGSASCAMVYPVSVNGEKTGFYDPWANDQDWGLYYALKYMDR